MNNVAKLEDLKRDKNCSSKIVTQLGSEQMKNYI